MPSRAAHTKSRSGCLRCKQRRVKCDEGAPCRDCNRRNEYCSLVTDPIYIASFKDVSSLPGPGTVGAGGGSPSSSATSNAAGAASSTSPIPPQQAPRHDLFASFPTSQTPLHQSAPYADWAEDLHLMAHWAINTSNTIMRRPAVTTLYQNVGPEISVRFPSAMHIMLSISSLHLAYLRPTERQKYISLSSRHQQHGIQQLSGAIRNVTRELIIPVFLTSALLPIACLADMCLARHTPDSPPTLEDVFSIFSLIRGVRDILYPIWPMLSEPDIQPVIEPIIDRYILHDNENYPLPSPLRERMTLLRESMLETHASYHDGSKEACHFALLELEKVCRDIAHVPPSAEGPYHVDYRKRRDIELGVLLKWQTTVSATYVNLLKKGHTAALIVLAHWVCLVKHLGPKWFLEGWAEGALELIREKVPEKEREWLEWPEGYLRDGREEETAMEEDEAAAGDASQETQAAGGAEETIVDNRATGQIFATPTPFP